MGVFDQFPYTNFHELNLDWILQALKEIEKTMDQFVSINALKYADPIQWDITTQYEKNTIVIEPNSGTAYISVQPVPSGVSIANTDYWTVVFDLGMFVVRAAKNLASKYEEDTTNTATQPINKDEWFVWGDTLYRALSNIIAGDQFVIGSNIEHFTIESVTGHLEDLNTNDKTNLVAAINDLLQILIDTCGDLTNLTTTDKTNLVAAINEVLQTLADTCGDLTNLTTADQTNLVAAINEIVANCGDLTNLTTTDKTNLVAAINEVKKYGGIFINVSSYGATGDGVTDDTVAIQAAVDDIGVDNYILYFPAGTYIVSAPITMPNNTGEIFGVGRTQTIIELQDNNGFVFTATSGVEIRNMTIKQVSQGTPTSFAIALLANSLRFNIHDITFFSNGVDVFMESGITEVTIYNISSFDWTRASIVIGDSGYCGSINVLNSFFKTTHGLVTNGALEIKYCDVMNAHGNTFITPLSNNVLITPATGQVASLLTFDGNCFDTSANGISLDNVGTITRVNICDNVVQEMSNCAILANNTNTNYLQISNNVIFHCEYPVNLAESSVIEGVQLNENIIAGGQVCYRLVGTLTGVMCNNNIFGSTLYSLTTGVGMGIGATTEGTAQNNQYINVGTKYNNASSNFLIIDPTDYNTSAPLVFNTYTQSCTTDANGNAQLTGLTSNTIIILKALQATIDMVIKWYWDISSQHWWIQCSDPDTTPKAGVTFDVTITYL